MDHPKKEALDSLERSHLVAYGTHVHEWHKTLLSLASAILTILVALQQNYVPLEPKSIWLLQACWASLALCVVVSLLLVWGKAQTRLEGANILRAKRISDGDQSALEMLQKTNGIYFSERKIFSTARQLQAFCFLVGFLSLSWFAILNVSPS
jgi:hypothetical protein